jgi:SPP1 gp7 family putative phage head morphogenesis protein
MVMAEMGGQLMATVYDAKKIELSRPGRQLWLFQAEAPQAFMSLPFPEAIEMYKSLPIPRRKEFLEVLREYSDRSGQARALMLKYIRETSKRKIIEALEQGRDLRQYLSDFQGFLGDLGVSPQNPAYLETVYRTNVSSAYGAGRYRQLTDPDVLEERPYVQYRTAGDGRVRPEHRELEGLIFRADDPAFAAIYPPNGFNCRCAVTSYTLQPGDEVATAPPAGYVPEPGFDQPPVTLIGGLG